MSNTDFTPFYKDYDKMVEYMKNGYSWFDMMYPRGSEAEAKELKIGKYAEQKTYVPPSNKTLSGHKRRRNT